MYFIFKKLVLAAVISVLMTSLGLTETKEASAAAEYVERFIVKPTSKTIRVYDDQGKFLKKVKKKNLPPVPALILRKNSNQSKYYVDGLGWVKSRSVIEVPPEMSTKLKAGGCNIGARTALTGGVLGSGNNACKTN